MSERIDALIHARWTLDVEPDVRVEEGIAVAIDNGRIIAILPAAEASERFAPDVCHERPEHVLMPGLINAHCHAGMALFRGFADDLALEQWLKDRIWPAESRWINQEFVADGTELAIAEMLLGGTTCFSDMYYFPDIVAEVALRTRMRAVVGMIALEFPTPWASSVDEYISKGLEVHDRYAPDPLITTTFAPHAPYSVSDATLKRIRQLADELEVPIHTHIHETAAEIAEALVRHDCRPLARLDGLGLITPAFVGVHATQLEPDEIALLGASRASVVHCPRSNLKLASGACPVAALLDAGVNVALGTDGAASNNRLDMFAEMQTAALLAKLVANDATAVPASAALQMATINAARALNLESEIGSISSGKAADLICVRLSDPGQLPVLNPISQLVYSASREHVSDVWINGDHLVSGGDLVRMDVAAIQDSARSWAARLLAE